MRDAFITQLELLLKPAVEVAGCTLWGCVRRGKALCVYIDKPGGVNIDDCTSVTHHIRGALMVHDPLRGEYSLEVSSPGLDRFFFTPQQYEEFKGHQIKLRLKAPQKGQRNFQGTIENVTLEKNEMTLQCGEDKQNFRFDDIVQANLVPDLKLKGISQ
jgi:ribosome maturation factor RimP